MSTIITIILTLLLARARVEGSHPPPFSRVLLVPFPTPCFRLVFGLGLVVAVAAVADVAIVARDAVLTGYVVLAIADMPNMSITARKLPNTSRNKIHLILQLVFNVHAVHLPVPMCFTGISVRFASAHVRVNVHIELPLTRSNPHNPPGIPTSYTLSNVNSNMNTLTERNLRRQLEQRAVGVRGLGVAEGLESFDFIFLRALSVVFWSVWMGEDIRRVLVSEWGVVARLEGLEGVEDWLGAFG
eukprot:1263415-Amorphochlora_amoeboformis.AAC.1